MEQIEQSVLQLSAAERRQFVQWFYDHAEELAAGEENHLHHEVKTEILARREEADARPELLEPWKGTTERVRARLHELRRQAVKVG